MNVLTIMVDNRNVEASLAADGIVTIREAGRQDAQYPIAKAVIALAERQGADKIIGSTVHELVRALVDKHLGR
jgi:hypothetical protein